MLTVTIVFETHSLTTDNEAGIASGWLPGSLSATGRTYAQVLGERRRNDGLAAVFVSDLARAVETATIAFQGSTIPIMRDARLRECNYGLLNGMPVSRLVAGRARHIDLPYPQGESYRQVVDRMRDFLHGLAARWAGSRMLLISHSANRWALDCLLMGRNLERLVDAPFDWQEGWTYQLPSGWTGEALPG